MPVLLVHFLRPLLTLALATVAASQPADPAAAMRQAVDGLIASDPTARAAGRDALMRLTRDDLPALRSIVASRGEVPVPMRAALHDIVVHVYLTGAHNFQGKTSGLLGVVLYNDGGVPFVGSARPGFDAYRVLQPGDNIVGLSESDEREQFEPQHMRPVNNYETLREWLSTTHTGEWVVVRILRNGQAKDVRVRLGPEAQPPPITLTEPDPRLQPGEDYWTKSFEPQLPITPVEGTRAATQPAARLPRKSL